MKYAPVCDKIQGQLSNIDSIMAELRPQVAYLFEQLKREELKKTGKKLNRDSLASANCEKPVRVVIGNSHFIDKVKSLTGYRSIANFLRSSGIKRDVFYGWVRNRSDIPYNQIINISEQLHVVPLKMNSEGKALCLGIDSERKYNYGVPIGLEEMIQSSDPEVIKSRLGITDQYLAAMCRGGTRLSLRVLDNLFSHVKDRIEYLAEWPK